MIMDINKNLEREMRRNLTGWKFQTTDWFAHNVFDIAAKEKTLERNWIFYNSCTKQRHKDQ